MQDSKDNKLELKESLFVYSINHHDADLEMREQLKLAADTQDKLKSSLREVSGLKEWTIIDTCNRWELYGVVDQEDIDERLKPMLTEHFSMNGNPIDEVMMTDNESAMIRHLFEVCSGLDSQMVGETEILGQVKSAFERAQEDKSTGANLNRIFNKAFQTAKWVRTNTEIGKGQVSIGNVAANLGSRIFEDLKECRVLLIGSGEVGTNTAYSLHNRAVKSITITSRNFDKSRSLAKELGAAVLEFDQFKDQLHDFDIVIACTAAPGAILDLKTIKKVMRQRSFKPMFFIDLALPRDIDPKAHKLSQVFIYNLDDISAIANENLENRKSEIQRCRDIIASKAWVTWLEVMRRSRLIKR